MLTSAYLEMTKGELPPSDCRMVGTGAECTRLRVDCAWRTDGATEIREAGM